MAIQLTNVLHIYAVELPSRTDIKYDIEAIVSLPFIISGFSYCTDLMHSR
jgi:hypothetical protein